MIIIIAITIAKLIIGTPPGGAEKGGFRETSDIMDVLSRETNFNSRTNWIGILENFRLRLVTPI